MQGTIARDHGIRTGGFSAPRKKSLAGFARGILRRRTRSKGTGHFTAVRDAVVAVGTLFSPGAIICKTLDHFIAAPWAYLHEFGETDHPGNDLRGGRMFYSAGTLLGN